ncbi:MAG: hypothetical protein ACLTTU_12725 [Bilophila wadsworthia]
MPKPTSPYFSWMWAKAALTSVKSQTVWRYRVAQAVALSSSGYPAAASAP